jgi:hypothetical protein
LCYLSAGSGRSSFQHFPSRSLNHPLNRHSPVEKRVMPKGSVLRVQRDRSAFVANRRRPVSFHFTLSTEDP